MRQKPAGGAALLGVFRGNVMDVERRPVGPIVAFDGATLPSLRTLDGHFVRLEALDPSRHASPLWPQMADHPHLWDYLFEEPPTSEAEFTAMLEDACGKTDWNGYAVCLPCGAPVGYAFYLSPDLEMGRIEVGNINFAPSLQRSPAATEAMYLMMQEAFSLGFRRYEWKCNALNMPSRRAAQRFGFSWEGIFRQHYIVKSRNRDTAWFAITDQDWPLLQTAFQTWLSVDNFDVAGQQYQSLRDLTAPARVASDPAQG